MALTVPASTERPFRLRATPAAAYARLRDVPSWAPLFPGVASIAPLDGAPDGLAAPSPSEFIWTMEPMGPPGVAVETVYACRYAFDDAARTIVFTPIEGVGTARFEGAITLEPAADGGTDGHVRLAAELQIPAPRFMRSVVEPAVALAIRQMTAEFLDRLDHALG